MLNVRETLKTRVSPRQLTLAKILEVTNSSVETGLSLRVKALVDHARQALQGLQESPPTLQDVKDFFEALSQKRGFKVWMVLILAAFISGVISRWWFASGGNAGMGGSSVGGRPLWERTQGRRNSVAN